MPERFRFGALQKTAPRVLQRSGMDATVKPWHDEAERREEAGRTSSVRGGRGGRDCLRNSSHRHRRA